MGVLEARKDAEVVGYQIVGEETKEASNVIDYYIHDEVTVNESSVFNANNDTTTGMANVIPGVNAPKLIASTSIYGDLGGGGADWAGGVTASFKLDNYESVAGNSTGEVTVKNVTLSSQRGYYEFKTSASKGVILPADGAYKLTCKYTFGGSPTFTLVFDTMVGNEVQHTSGSVIPSNLEATDNIPRYRCELGDVPTGTNPYAWSRLDFPTSYWYTNSKKPAIGSTLYDEADGWHYSYTIDYFKDETVTETYVINGRKGEGLYFIANCTNSYSTAQQVNPQITVTITKGA